MQQEIEDIKKLKEEIKAKFDKFKGVYEGLYEQNDILRKRVRKLEDKICHYKETKKSRKKTKCES